MGSYGQGRAKLCTPPDLLTQKLVSRLIRLTFEAQIPPTFLAIAYLAVWSGFCLMKSELMHSRAIRLLARSSLSGAPMQSVCCGPVGLSQ